MPPSFLLWSIRTLSYILNDYILRFFNITSTDENPKLLIESFAIKHLRRITTKLN